MSDPKMLQEMANVGAILNLKENRFLFKNKSSYENVPVSTFLEVHANQEPEKED
jgi:hypothetical protein